MIRKKQKNAGNEVHYVKGSKLPGILVIFVVALSVILGARLGAGWEIRKANRNAHKVQVSADALHQEIERIGELALVKYYYTNMGKFEDVVQWLDHDVPFTTKSFILSYDGAIKAGIHLDEVAIQVEGKKIQVILPEAKILSHDVDMDSVTLFDEKNSIFNGLSADDVTGFLCKQQDMMEEKAKQNGLLERACQTAEDTIRTYLTNYLELVTGDKESYEIEINQLELVE